MGLQGTYPNRWVRGCGGWQRWLWGDLAKVWIQSLGLAGSQLEVQVAPVLPRPCGGGPQPASQLLIPHSWRAGSAWSLRSVWGSLEEKG